MTTCKLGRVVDERALRHRAGDGWAVEPGRLDVSMARLAAIPGVVVSLER